MFWDEFPSKGGGSSGNISGGGMGSGDNVGALIPHALPDGGIVTTGGNMQVIGYDFSTTSQSSANNNDDDNNNNTQRVEQQPRLSTTATSSTTQVDSPSLVGVGGGGGGGLMNPNLIFGGMSFNSSSTPSNNGPGGSSSMTMTRPSQQHPTQQPRPPIVGVAQSSKTLLPSTPSSSQGDVVVAAAAEGAVVTTTTTTTTGAAVQLQPPQPQLQQVQAHAYFMWLLQQQALAQQQQQQQTQQVGQGQQQLHVQAQLQQSHQQAAWAAIQAQQQAQVVQQQGEVGVGRVLQGHNVGQQQGQIIQRGGNVPPPPPPPSVVATTTNNNGVPQQSSNPATGGVTTSLPTLNASAISQLQLIQLLQLQQHQQQLRNAASQQQQQNNLMQQPSQLQSHQEAHQLKEAQQLQQQQNLKLLIKMQQQQQQQHQQNQQGVTPTIVQVVPLNLPPTVAGTPSFLNVTTQQVNTGGYHPSLAAVSHSRRGGSVVGLGGGSSLLLSSSPTVVPNPAHQSTMQGSTAAASNNFRFISASETDGGDGGGGKRGPSRKRPAATKKRRDMTSSPTSDDMSADGDDYYGPHADDNTVIPEFTTEEQRIRYNRERNREHAKNTRIRKKAYVERLKIAVDELCRERDTLLSERTSASCQMIETHSKRVDVLRSFFALRAGYNSSDVRRELWSGILDESSFTCRLPVTPYQSFPSSEVQVSNCQRTIVGVDAMIADAAANYVFLDSIVDRAMYPDGKIKFQYTLVTEESVVAGTQLMARWAMSTLNANQCGSNTELQQRGMLICKFNVAHKIVSIEIMFDVMAFMLQVKLAMGYDNFNDIVIPNTVQTCGQKVYDYPMVITSASRPYTIIQVNDRWEKLTGYTRQEVVGLRSCSILQGVKSSCNNNSDDAESTAIRREIDLLMGPVLFQRPSCAMMTNYTKSGRRYRQYLSIYPLSTDSNISHYVGLTTFVQWIDNDDDNDVVVPDTSSIREICGKDDSGNIMSKPQQHVDLMAKS